MLNLDTRQADQKSAGSIELSHRWMFGQPVTESGMAAQPSGRQDSYLSECECPDDCLRDHENE